MVLDATSKRPHRLGRLGGEILDGKDKLDVGDVGSSWSGDDSAVEGTERGEGLLSVDVVY